MLKKRVDTPEQLMDHICPDSTGAEQRKNFAALVGFKADVVLSTWHKYAKELTFRHIKLLDLVWTCSYLRLYLSFSDTAKIWKTKRETVRRRIIATIDAAGGIFDEIEWDSRFDDHVPETGPFKSVTFAVDVIECPAGRPDDGNLETFQGSTSAGALKYQVVTQIATGRIVRVDGGFPSIRNKEIYDESGLSTSIIEGELGIGDKCFIGSQHLLVPFKGGNLTQAELIWNAQLASVIELKEKTNRLIKKFLAFGQIWRGDFNLHGRAFKMICHMINIHIVLHPIQKSINPLLEPLDEETETDSD